jgi:hypothetical protein
LIENKTAVVTADFKEVFVNRLAGIEKIYAAEQVQKAALLKENAQLKALVAAGDYRSEFLAKQVRAFTEQKSANSN